MSKGHGGECKNERRYSRNFQRGLAANFVDRQIPLKFCSYLQACHKGQII